MRIDCDRASLLEAFHRAAMFAPTRSVKPILQNVKFACLPGALTLIASGPDADCRLSVPNVEIHRAGIILVPLSLRQILENSVSRGVSIEWNGGSETTIACDNDRFFLPARNPDDFPVVAEFAETAYHEISSGLLCEMVRRTAFATDIESSRYALGGVLMELHGTSAICVATDGRRLVIAQGPAVAVNDHAFEESPIIRVGAVHLIESTFAGSNDQLQIALCRKRLLVRGSRGEVGTRLLEGRFPRWREVIPPPRAAAARVKLTAGAALAAIRRVAIMTDNETRGVDFVFRNTLLRMAGVSAQGASNVETPIDFAGEAETRLDNRFVSDLLSSLDPDTELTIEVDKEHGSPVLFEAGDGYRCVLMPLAASG